MACVAHGNDALPERRMRFTGGGGVYWVGRGTLVFESNGGAIVEAGAALHWLPGTGEAQRPPTAALAIRVKCERPHFHPPVSCLSKVTFLLTAPGVARPRLRA
ncbi:hypothetical protein NDU88_007074 [Pleurodeles waltl]|uniref:Uncharacterized protein n=1 Tax=Pleurodeles waltl TaxID=8319 RepID=A0AAV7MFV4_PLEWA|nr:hypothetical protein NDU88_007074 [Pleurodeles waltl]